MVNLLLLATLFDANSALINNAEGHTPVKFITCFLQKQTCEVTARFRDMFSCKQHLEIQTAYCDRKSDPAKIVCTRKDSPLRDVAWSVYCVPGPIDYGNSSPAPKDEQEGTPIDLAQPKVRL